VVERSVEEEENCNASLLPQKRVDEEAPFAFAIVF